MEKNYNYTRRKLQLPEYGRHIQEMVESLKDIEDREERTKQAHAVIAVMGNLNPLLRDTADFTHKLWDHLYIIANFELDIDSPYPLPTREVIEAKPKRLSYNSSRIGFKHYGKYVVKMLRSLENESDKEAAVRTVDNIARYMRSKSFEFNQEHPNNEVIIKDIRKMANCSIEIDEDAINNLRSDYKNNQSAHQQKGAKNNKGAKSGQQRGAGGKMQHHHNNGGNNSNNPQNQNRNYAKGGAQRRNPNNRQNL
ncbi:MAG: DUF4290 domain-containing protein [Rikenellaceae bacterium]